MTTDFSSDEGLCVDHDDMYTKVLNFALKSAFRPTVYTQLIRREIEGHVPIFSSSATDMCDLCDIRPSLELLFSRVEHEHSSTPSRFPDCCIVCCILSKGNRGPYYVNQRTGPASGINEFRLVIPDASRLCQECFVTSVNMVLWARDNIGTPTNKTEPSEGSHFRSLIDIDVVIVPSWKYVDVTPSPFDKKEWDEYIAECNKYGTTPQIIAY